jgi:hypothetical protein
MSAHEVSRARTRPTIENDVVSVSLVVGELGPLNCRHLARFETHHPTFRDAAPACRAGFLALFDRRVAERRRLPSVWRSARRSHRRVIDRRIRGVSSGLDAL